MTWNDRLIQRVRQAGGQRRCHARTSHRRAFSRRVFFEPLEQRALLATFTVVVNGDALGSCGPVACTLRDAVVAANASPGADTINFGLIDNDPTDNNYTITLASELSVTESLTINGFPNSQLSLSGNNATRLFNFAGGGANTYVLNNLTLAEGNTSGFGGAIRMSDGDDTLTINDSVIRDSSAFVVGGIHVESGALLNLNRSAVINNSATAESGGLEIRNANATLTNVTVSGNSSGQIGGISNVAKGPGATSRLTIRNL